MFFEMFSNIWFQCLVLFKLASLNFGARDPLESGCWKNNLVPYKMIGFPVNQEKRILREIESMHKVVCLRWVDISKVKRTVRGYVKFLKTADMECSTQMWVREPGTGSKMAVIRLSDWCFERNSITHEMMHALGFTHEHQRRDRDCYMDVDRHAALYDRSYKIIRNTPEWIEQFPYDRYSVLHYKRSEKLSAAIERRHFNFWEPLGNLEGKLTYLDIWKLRFKFCQAPHYCEVYTVFCDFMNKMEHYCYSRDGPK